MSQVDSGGRAGFRTRDPAVLGARLASQLLAYRCSTVYGPDPALLRELVATHALPLLASSHDVRHVTIAGWPEAGPSLAHLVAELLRQLELEPAGEPGDLAGLRQVLARAHRNSSRPLVLVLHDLDRLLDDDRDRGADRRLIDALAALVELPVHGLQLVMTVHERDLGAFRHLLRGRWRLLANDLRLHGDDRRLPIPLPIAAGTTAAATAATAAGRGPLIAALAGLLALGGASYGLVQRGEAATARQQLAACQAAKVTCPEVQPPIAIEPPVPKDIPPDPPPTPPDLPAPEPVPGDSSTGADGVVEPVIQPPKTCPAVPGDGPCAKCTRKSCCAQLSACKTHKWKQCVLAGKVPSDQCAPEAIEQGCRSLALCALEYQCNAVCYNKK